MKYLRWILLSTLVGVLAGIAAGIFLYSLNWVTNLRIQNPALIWFLPIGGFFTGWLFHKYGKNITRGHNLILDEIHSPKNVIPFRMAPFILLGTLITHIFGGSAGREGTAVQMGASLADQVSHFLNVTPKERKNLLVAGISAGFSAAIGAPIAGFIFGIEVLQIGKIKFQAVIESFIASYIAYFTSVLLLTPHSVFPKVNVDNFNLKYIFSAVVLGVVFGLAIRIFLYSTHFIEKLFNKMSLPSTRLFTSGVILSLLFFIEGSDRFTGLGINFIQQSFQQASLLSVPLFKIFFTSLTVGSGFKGGEFIPLVYIGSTLGSYFSTILPIALSLSTALGFVAVFGGAANTPLACSILAVEIFGPHVIVYAFIACYISYYLSGNKGIYKSQRVVNEKLLH